jgi:hypothetical protein
MGRLPDPVSPVPDPPPLGGVGLVGASFFLTLGLPSPPGVSGRGSPVGFCAPEGFWTWATAKAVLAANNAAAAAAFSMLLILVALWTVGDTPTTAQASSRSANPSVAHP